MEMKKRRYYRTVLALSAAVTVAGAGIGHAWAYFTTYAQASGGYTVHLSSRTEIREDFSDWTKHVVIENAEGSEPVYVRVKAFCGSQYTIEYAGEGWSLAADGYYYYEHAVSGEAGHNTTAPLDLKIGGIPADPEVMEQFNVIVIYESTPVRYHEDGTPYTVYETDWSVILDSGKTGSSGGVYPDRTDSNEGDFGEESLDEIYPDGMNPDAVYPEVEGGGEG